MSIASRHIVSHGGQIVVRLTLALVVAAAAGLGAGCKDEQGSADKPPPAPKANPNNVQALKPAIPLGKHVPCSTLVDPVKIGASMGKEVTIQDVSKIDDRANAVCRIRLGGTPLTEAELKKLQGKDPEIAILGIVPGDEICQITLLGSFPYSVDDATKKCTKDGGTVLGEGEGRIGDFTCMETVQAGSTDRYIVTIMDAETKCTYRINPGPGATDLALTNACAKAALDTIGPENLKYQ